MTQGALNTLTIEAAAPLVSSQAISSSALLDACLEQIDRRDPELNAFVTVMADAAREQARTADSEIAGGRYRGPLHGIPISLKDLIDLRGTPTTAASKVRVGHVALADAPVVARLREAGAVIVGKCNLHEFAFGTTNEESAFGPTRNPYDSRRSPGGSSGGSAAAVAAGMCFASVGSDTGGSIRIPAAACGLVGVKPTFDELSCDGVVPLSRTLDHIGPIARTVTDASLLFRAMAGSPSADAAPDRPAPPASLSLGMLGGYFLEVLDVDVRRQFVAAVARLREASARIDEVRVPHAGDVSPIYLHIVFAESGAYHARTLERQASDYTAPVRLRLEMARYVLAEDYSRALRGRTILQAEVDACLGERDGLILPTLPIPAPLLGASEVDMGGVRDSVRNAMLRLTQLFNITGHPAITLPIGVTSDGLPCGLQIVGRRGETLALLKTALSCERCLQ